MKQWILSALLFGASMTTALAQTKTDSLRAQMGYRPLSTGDLYQGMSKTIPSGRVVLPYGLEVTFDKTSHLIFPSAIRYVDLGSNKLIAQGKWRMRRTSCVSRPPCVTLRRRRT